MKIEYENLGKQAFNELFPEKNKREITVTYSKKFQAYNANVTYTSQKISFKFSHLWKKISEEIQIGLAQHLLLKIFKQKKRTLNLELYEKFMEKIPKYTPNNKKSDPELEESFHRVNQEYFNDFMEKPSLEWGFHSLTQLGTYSYQKDKIRISTVFRNIEENWILDYIMYHELIHKKLGLKHKEGRCSHHPPEFRALEKKFKIKDAEKKLKSFLRNQRKKKIPPEPRPKLNFFEKLFQR